MGTRTWLDLSKALRREAGVQGDGPSSVENQQGMYANIVQWIDQAWLHVQGLHNNWDFMWATGTITSNGSRDYVLSPVPGRIYPRSIRATDGVPIDGPVVDGDIVVPKASHVDFIDWLRFNELYKLYDGSKEQPPTVMTLLPNPRGTVRFSDRVPAGWTITFEYQAEPSRFANGSAHTTIPDPYDDIVVFKGLIDYGLFYNAPEAVQHGQARYEDLLGTLRERHLIAPQIRIGRFISGHRTIPNRYW
jgi:hypothetical protein